MLRIGWASREFTPDRPAMLQGQRYRRVARESADPLTTTAMAVADEAVEEAAVLVSCDLANVTGELLGQIRERVDAPGLSSEQVVPCATHTHTSVVFEDGRYEHPGGDVMTPRECRELVATRVAETVEAAWDRRQPRTLGRGFGHAVVGHNRYAVYADGHGEMYGDTDREDFVRIGGYEDHSLDVLFTWDPDGSLAGVAVAVPCPSQVDEHREQFSADYWHDVRVELRSRLGAQLPVLALCGAAGDQSPHHLLHGEEATEMRDRRGRTRREEIADRVADAVEDALSCTEPDPDAEVALSHSVDHLELPALCITEADREWARAEYESRSGEDNWRDGRRAAGLREIIEHDPGDEREPVGVEVHTLRAGDLAIATSPFELFLDYGLRIEARSPAAQTVPVQLACGRSWYLPTGRAREHGGYGTVPVVCEVGPEGGERLVEETLAAIDRLF